MFECLRIGWEHTGTDTFEVSSLRVGIYPLTFCRLEGGSDTGMKIIPKHLSLSD